MKNLIDIISVVLVLAGAALLVVYELQNPTNGLLVASLILEAAGILSYVFLGKLIK